MLTRWRINRTQMALTIGRACPTCPRGLVATRDVAAGEAVMELPLELLAIKSHDLGYLGFPSVRAQHREWMSAKLNRPSLLAAHQI